LLEPASRLEQLCRWVPVVGWLAAAFLRDRRRSAFEIAVNMQLLRRGEVSDAWGPDPTRKRLAACMCALIQREFNWDNAHFLPDDPLDLLLWHTGWFSGDAGALLFLMGPMLREAPPSLNMTLGEFVDNYILDQPPLLSVASAYESASDWHLGRERGRPREPVGRK
jgi:hypothetical protein